MANRRRRTVCTSRDVYKRQFPGRSVSIVVGSDVVLHASSYKKSVTPDSIHTFDHVVFRRTEPDAEPADYSCITGKVLELLSLIHI